MRATRSRPAGGLVKSTEVKDGDVVFSSGGWRAVTAVSDPYFANDILGDRRLFVRITCGSWSSSFRADHHVFTRKAADRRG